MLDFLKSLFESPASGSGLAGNRHRIAASMPDTIAGLQQLAAMNAFGRWMVKDSQASPDGRRLTLHLHCRESFRVPLEGKTMMGAMAVNWTEAQGDFMRAVVPYEFELLLQFSQEGPGGTLLTVSANEYIDPRGMAFNHKDFAAPSMLRVANEFVGWLVASLRTI